MPDNQSADSANNQPDLDWDIPPYTKEHKALRVMAFFNWEAVFQEFADAKGDINESLCRKAQQDAWSALEEAIARSNGRTGVYRNAQFLATVNEEKVELFAIQGYGAS